MGNQIKKQWNWSSLFVIILTAALLAGCSADKEPEAIEDGKLNIVTTIGQIADPISIIGGEYVHVTSLMGPGVDPHLYNATTGDILKLEKSDVIFYSGLYLEANMMRVFEELGNEKTVLGIGDTIAVEKLLKDENGAIDPHIWFDIDLWKEALEAAANKLAEIAPEHANYFNENKLNYFNELDTLKQESIAKLGEIPEAQRILVTAHDAFGYFGRMQNVEVIGLQGLSTEAEVGLTDIEDTIDILVKYKVPAVFIESSINPDSINAVIEGSKRNGLDVKLGGELYSDAMGDSNTAEGTYIGMYRHNVDTIYEALSGKGE